MHEDPRSDEALLSGIASGERAAFAALFRRRRLAVYRFALHMTGEPSVADDIVQEVFLTVIHDAGRFEPDRATAVAWLCGIARNHARRRLHRDRVVAPFADGDEDAAARLAAPDPDPLEGLTRAERLDVLRRAVLSLPVRYREAVVLCDLQEFSYADAAAAIGCAVGTVRSRLHRGRALLTVKLGVLDELSPVR